jgi:hypothetical protein
MQAGYASMASSVDAIRGSGPVMRRPSMDRRAFGIFVHLLIGMANRSRTSSRLVPLERSLSVPPRG